MRRFEFAIDVDDGFEIDGESIDNIKSYLCHCFKVNHVNVNSWNLPEWLCRLDSTDLEIPL